MKDSTTGRVAKWAVVTLLTACWFVSSAVRSRFAGGETNLDASWLMGLAALLKQGMISGRDFHFTYGPAAQFMGWIGTMLTASGSAFDAYRMISLVFWTVSALCVAAVLLLYEPISWKQTIVVYSLLLLLNVFGALASIRMTLLLLCAALTYRIVGVAASRRLLHAAALAAFCFLCQLVTPDIGIFGVVVVVGSLVAYGVLERRFPSLLFAAGFLTTFGLLNIAVGIFYKMSSSRYKGLFDYQRYALETMRGYNNLMGIDWQMSGIQTLLLLLVFTYTVVLAVWIMWRGNRLDGCLIVSAMLASLVGLKGALVRSDVGHICYAAAPLVFTFLLVGKRDWNTRIGQGIWCLLAAGLFAVVPGAGLVAPNEIWKVATLEYPLPSMIRNMSEASIAQEAVLPINLLSDDFRNRSERPLLAFPYENYIPIVLRRPVFAPVLQSYSALTPALERFYVEELDRQRPLGLDIVYGIDGIAAWPIDGVPIITRVPLIFENLYRNFDLEPGPDNPEGHYILEARSNPRKTTFKDMSFTTERWSNSAGITRFSEATPCGLLRIEMTVATSYRKYFFRPSGIELTFRRGAAPVLTTPVRPIELDRPFVTYISLLRPRNFRKLFQDDPIPSPSWDNIIYAREAADKLSARPTGITIHHVQCVNPETFVEESTAPDEMDSEALALSVQDTDQTTTGYAVLTPRTGIRPRLTARIVRTSASTIYHDVPATPPATDHRIKMPGALANDVGVAIVNPHPKPTNVELTYESSQHLQHLRKISLKLMGGQQIAKLLVEFFPGDDTNVASGTLTITSNQSVSVVAARFVGQQFDFLPSETSTADNELPIVFPQVVLGGGWVTALIVSNAADAAAEGQIDFFSPEGKPMVLPMNGGVSSSFKYAVAPGKTYLLKPETPGNRIK